MFLGLPIWVWRLDSLGYREPAHIPKTDAKRRAQALAYYYRKKGQTA